MNKINLDKVLFHGVTHRDDDELVSRNDLSLKRLDSIFKCGAILSRKEQRKVIALLETEYQFPLKNGEDYVCICTRKGKNKLIKCSDAFYQFIESGISLILDKKLLEDLEIREESFQDGEIQVKNKIPLKYLVGVAVNCSSDDSWVKHGLKVSKRADKQYIEQDLKYSRSIVEQVRIVLDKNNLQNINIYSLDDGKIITSMENVLSRIYKKSEHTL